MMSCFARFLEDVKPIVLITHKLGGFFCWLHFLSVVLSRNNLSVLIFMLIFTKVTNGLFQNLTS